MITQTSGGDGDHVYVDYLHSTTTFFKRVFAYASLENIAEKQNVHRQAPGLSTDVNKELRCDTCIHFVNTMTRVHRSAVIKFHF